jgi:hypothetical protein
MPSEPGAKARRHGLIPPFMSAVAEAVLELPAAGEDLRLGGANALAEYYLGHRISVDLDFFAMEAAASKRSRTNSLIGSPPTE